MIKKIKLPLFLILAFLVSAIIGFSNNGNSTSIGFYCVSESKSNLCNHETTRKIVRKPHPPIHISPATAKKIPEKYTCGVKGSVSKKCIRNR